MRLYYNEWYAKHIATIYHYFELLRRARQYANEMFEFEFEFVNNFKMSLGTKTLHVNHTFAGLKYKKYHDMHWQPAQRNYVFQTKYLLGYLCGVNKSSIGKFPQTNK